LIADATSKATSPANHAVSPRLRAHSTLERPLSATCLCGRFWPRAACSPMVAVRPIAACRALEKRTFLDFAEWQLCLWPIGSLTALGDP
jgi:hypothetical protein